MKRLAITVTVLLVSAVWCFAVDQPAPNVKQPVQVQPKDPVIKPGDVKPAALCCISGKYAGVHQDVSCAPGTKPKKEKFTMEIRQAGNCGGTFKAKVTDESGKVTDFAGTVKPGGPKGCCLIEGKSTSGTDNIRLKGTLCKKLMKWEGKGEYQSNKCKGVWEMHKI